ncbi:hypothetical protein FY136_28825 (plasmid) [Agrobacterium tumefaciens]|uniref:zeta toxin family protein n=1 Tax=Agrobacterium tumefaciens TaxID=358 RepID=UPI0021D23C5C|nr:zeta toxin family protein [Agrobacterium tumefaciens]UXT53268.1 hypothetical protein FY136_28825 [Agrobacterium tumefaciens]
MSRPSLTVLAGPNGSGKSSIYEKLQPVGEFVNADVIEAALPPGLSKAERQVQAGRIAVTRISKLLADRIDFTFETTLSSRHAISTIEKAKDQGFGITLIYVVLDHPQRNIDRVRFRVASGGHDIPADAITRRYEAGFSNLDRALRLSDAAAIIDNSAREPHIVFEIEKRKIVSERISTDLHRRLEAIVRRTTR